MNKLKNENGYIMLLAFGVFVLIMFLGFTALYLTSDGAKRSAGQVAQTTAEKNAELAAEQLIIQIQHHLQTIVEAHPHHSFDESFEVVIFDEQDKWYGEEGTAYVSNMKQNETFPERYTLTITAESKDKQKIVTFDKTYDIGFQYSPSIFNYAISSFQLSGQLLGDITLKEESKILSPSSFLLSSYAMNGLNENDWIRSKAPSIENSTVFSKEPVRKWKGEPTTTTPSEVDIHSFTTVDQPYNKRFTSPSLLDFETIENQMPLDIHFVTIELIEDNDSSYYICDDDRHLGFNCYSANEISIERNDEPTHLHEFDLLLKPSINREKGTVKIYESGTFLLDGKDVWIDGNFEIDGGTLESTVYNPFSNDKHLTKIFVLGDVTLTNPILKGDAPFVIIAKGDINIRNQSNTDINALIYSEKQLTFVNEVRNAHFTGSLVGKNVLVSSGAINKDAHLTLAPPVDPLKDYIELTATKEKQYLTSYPEIDYYSISQTSFSRKDENK